MELEVMVRPAVREELDDFVVSSWLQSYTRSLPAKLMRADARFGLGRERYWTNQRMRIERILATPTVRVLVATVDDMVVGWACEDRAQRKLHYIYVKDTFRRQGIANKLADWARDANGGMVALTHLPPPWYSRPTGAGEHTPWQSHVIIDLVSGD